jgi:hypothetical protein
LRSRPMEARRCAFGSATVPEGGLSIW